MPISSYSQKLLFYFIKTAIVELYIGKSNLFIGMVWMKAYCMTAATQNISHTSSTVAAAIGALGQ